MAISYRVSWIEGPSGRVLDSINWRYPRNAADQVARWLDQAGEDQLVVVEVEDDGTPES